MDAKLEYIANAIAALHKSVNDMSAAINRIEQRLGVQHPFVHKVEYVPEDRATRAPFGHKVEYVPEDRATAWHVPMDGELAYSREREAHPHF